MARINLLPWRQEERLRKNKEFGMMLAAAAAVAIVLVLLALSLLGRELSNQEQANQTISDENKRLDGILTEIADLEQQKQEMLNRMQLIQDLQGKRSIPVRVWDDIARAIPKNMYITGIKREGDLIALVGYAENTRIVSDLIRNLDKTPWLDDSFMPMAQDSNVQAYATTNAPRSSANVNRQTYPEDSYILFSVVTHVKADVPTEGENVDVNATGEQASTETQAPTEVQAPAEVVVPDGQQSAVQPVQAPQGGEQVTAQEPSTTQTPAAAQQPVQPVATDSAQQGAGQPAAAPAGGQQ